MDSHHGWFSRAGDQTGDMRRGVGNLLNQRHTDEPVGCYLGGLFGDRLRGQSLVDRGFAGGVFRSDRRERERERQHECEQN